MFLHITHRSLDFLLQNSLWTSTSRAFVSKLRSSVRKFVVERQSSHLLRSAQFFYNFPVIFTINGGYFYDTLQSLGRRLIRIWSTRRNANFTPSLFRSHTIINRYIFLTTCVWQNYTLLIIKIILFMLPININSHRFSNQRENAMKINLFKNLDILQIIWYF